MLSHGLRSDLGFQETVSRQEAAILLHAAAFLSSLDASGNLFPRGMSQHATRCVRRGLANSAMRRVPRRRWKGNPRLHRTNSRRRLFELSLLLLNRLENPHFRSAGRSIGSPTVIELSRISSQDSLFLPFSCFELLGVTACSVPSHTSPVERFFLHRQPASRH